MSYRRVQEDIARGKREAPVGQRYELKAAMPSDVFITVDTRDGICGYLYTEGGRKIVRSG